MVAEETVRALEVLAGRVRVQRAIGRAEVGAGYGAVCGRMASGRSPMERGRRRALHQGCGMKSATHKLPMARRPKLRADVQVGETNPAHVRKRVVP